MKTTLLVRCLTFFCALIALFTISGCVEKTPAGIDTETPLELQFNFFESPKNNIINGVIFGDNVFVTESKDTITSNHMYYFGDENSSDDGAMIVTDKENRIIGYIVGNQILKLVYHEETVDVYFTDGNNTVFRTINSELFPIKSINTKNYKTKSSDTFLSTVNNIASDLKSIYDVVHNIISPQKLSLAGIITDIVARLSNNNKIIQNTAIIAGGFIGALEGGPISVIMAIYALYQNELLNLWFGEVKVTDLDVNNISYGQFIINFNVQNFDQIGNTSWLNTKCVIKATQQLKYPGKIHESEMQINSSGNFTVPMILKEPDLYLFEVRLYRVEKFSEKVIEECYLSGGKFSFVYNQLDVNIINQKVVSSNQSITFNLESQISALSLIDSQADNQIQQIEKGIYIINEQGKIETYSENQSNKIEVTLMKGSQNINNYFSIDYQNYFVRLKEAVEYGGYILTKGKNGNYYYSFSKTNPEKLQLSYEERPYASFYNLIPVNFYLKDKFCWSIFNINIDIAGAFFIKELRIYTFGVGWKFGSDVEMVSFSDGHENLYISQLHCPEDTDEYCGNMYLDIKAITESGKEINSPNNVSYVLEKGNTWFNGTILN